MKLFIIPKWKKWWNDLSIYDKEYYINLGVTMNHIDNDRHLYNIRNKDIRILHTFFA